MKEREIVTMIKRLELTIIEEKQEYQIIREDMYGNEIRGKPDFERILADIGEIKMYLKESLKNGGQK